MPRISLTTRDYDAANIELETKATSLFSSWTKFNLSNIGTVFLRLKAMMTDQFSWYLNRVIRQAWLATVDTRRNAQHVLSRTGYTMAGRSPASVDITFSFVGGGTHGQDVIIPAGTIVETTTGGYHFETIAAGTIIAGQPSVDITAKNWTARTEQVEADGTAKQEIRLSNENVIEGTIVFTLGGGWTEEDDLLDSGPTDKHYKVEYDDRVRAILIFGDGTTGEMPSGTATITYNTGGGSGANDVAIGALTKLIGTFLDIIAAPVQLETTNAAEPSGGSDEETIDTARKQAPKITRADKLTITREDHQVHGQEVDGVARILALAHQEEAGIAAAFFYLWVVPTGGGVPSSGLKDDVVTYLTTVKPILSHETLVMNDGEYVTITPVGTVTKKDGFTAADVKTAVDLAVSTYFDYLNVDEANEYTMRFGYDKDTFYTDSELVAVIVGATINDLPCVENLTLSSPAGNVSIGPHEIPELGSLAGLVVS